MISSIIVIILQFMGIIKPETDISFMKVYLPICIIEVVIYFKLLFKWGENDRML